MILFTQKTTISIENHRKKIRRNIKMPEIAELEIPEIVKDYLEPISDESPSGIDASNEEEYFILNMEIPKTTPDYKKCIELSAIILKEKSKDIKIASWLCFAMFRTEKVKGLLNGLKIIYHLLKKFDDKLYPSNIIHRSKAIQFLNQSRFVKLVEREIPTLSNSKDYIEAGIVLTGIVEESEKRFSDNVPVLKSIIEVIQSHIETANELLAPAKQKSEKPPIEQQPEKKVDEVKKTAPESVIQPKSEEKPAQQVVPVKESSPQPVRVSSENDALLQLRQILTQFFEYQPDGTKKERIPESYIVFGISRQLQWGRLFRPPETEGITQIEAPNSIMQANIKKWFETSDWDTLIPRVELNFLKGDSPFPYWLDTQRFVIKALEEKGGNYTLAAEEIKRQLSQLLKRIPDLQNLKFKDRQTPFANDETIKWIYNDVISSASSGEQKDQVMLPPIMGEDYEQINNDYKQACSQLPKNVEINIAAMQKGIDIDERRKGKFLRRLNLANYCMLAKLYELAKVHLTELNLFIEEYNLSIWEPALCTAAWQSMYLVNKELISGTRDKEMKASFEKEQKELFNKIAKYDSIIAIKLKQKK
jgi:type VI secretion system protein VasJ